MSAYSIYKTATSSFKVVGQISKVHYYILVIIWLTASIVVPLIFSTNLGTAIRNILLLTFVLVFISMAIYNRYVNNHIKIIGELKITRTCLVKSIGGIIQRYYYEDLTTIETKKHLRSVFGPLNNDGTVTYRIKITCKNGKEEFFIVSSQSSSKPDINLITSLKTLEKITKTDIHFIKK